MYLGDKRIVMPPEDAPIPKTRLNEKQLREFEDLLLAKRQELVGDVTTLTNEALRLSDGGGSVSHMPIHMADQGTDNWEQEFNIGLMEKERARILEIDDALDRIALGTYGVCMATHRPIKIARLRAKPWAKYGIEYARLREQGKV